MSLQELVPVSAGRNGCMVGSQVWSKHSLQSFANGLVRVEADLASGNKLDNGSNGKLSSCFNPSKPLSIDRYSS